MPYKAQTPFVAGDGHPEQGDITVFEEYGGGIWNGILDHSAAVSFAWDASNFFIGVKVADDTHQLNMETDGDPSHMGR